MRARFRSDREQRNKQAWVSIRCHAGTLSKHTRRFHVDCATFQSAVMRARFRSLCGRPFPGPGRFQSAVMRARFRSASINDVQRLKGFNPLSCGHAFEANLANCCISRLRFNPLSCGHAFEAQIEDSNEKEGVSIRCHAGTLSKLTHSKPKCKSFFSANRRRARPKGRWSRNRRG